MSKKVARADTSRYSSDPIGRIVGETVWKIEVKKKLRFQAILFLLGKIRYDPDEWEDKDLELLNLLYHDQVDLLEKTRDRDSNYRPRFYFLCRIKDFIGHLNQHLLRRDIKKNGKTMFWKFPEDCVHILLDPYQYFGYKFGELKNVNFSYTSFIIQLVKRTKAFIGVGYNDKGKCRSTSHSGCPSLREILEVDKFRKAESVDPYTIDYPPILFASSLSEVII